LDQGGNVFEWTETLETYNGETVRSVRGGGWYSYSLNDGEMQSSGHNFTYPVLEVSWFGFRLGRTATVPEPSTVLPVLAVLSVLFSRRRKLAV
jgi:formylglycine-generating enzyme required for sulfatase activity